MSTTAPSPSAPSLVESAASDVASRVVSDATSVRAVLSVVASEAVASLLPLQPNIAAQANAMTLPNPSERRAAIAVRVMLVDAETLRKTRDNELRDGGRSTLTREGTMATVAMATVAMALAATVACPRR
jgi:hypothetical protein